MSKARHTAAKRTKAPQQRRSVTTVDAILQAAVQVLRRDGKAKLTTTRIAARAGVSVGTLYQYFPNKTALLQEALRRHLGKLAAAMEAACRENHGQPLAIIADGIADAWITTKLRTVDASIALYSVVEDIEGRAIANELQSRLAAALEIAFRSAPDGVTHQPEIVAATLLGALSGASREMLDPLVSAAIRTEMGGQLRILVRAYVLSASSPAPVGTPTYRETPSRGELAVA